MSNKMANLVEDMYVGTKEIAIEDLDSFFQTTYDEFVRLKGDISFNTYMFLMKTKEFIISERMKEALN